MVKDGEIGNAQNFNSSFMSREDNTDTVGKVDLKNPGSDEVLDVQQVINDNIDTLADHETRITANEVTIADHETRITDNENNKVDKNLSTVDNTILRSQNTNTGEYQGSGVTIDDLDNITGVNDLTVSGNLTVEGTTTTLDTETVESTDANITLNKGGTQASADLAGGGFNVEMSDATDAGVKYDSTLTSKFKIGEDGSEHEVADLGSNQTFSTAKTYAYDNTASGLTATDHKAAIDELKTEIDNTAGAIPGDTDALPEGSTNLYFNGKDTDQLAEGATNKYNRTHTGEVTGSEGLTLDKTAITNKTTVTAASGDFVLISDTSDSGNLKKVDANEFIGGGGGGAGSAAKLIGGGNISWDKTAGTVVFDSDFFLEFPSLDYTANTIPVSESGFVLNADGQVAYVTPNDTNPGGNLTVSLGALSAAGASDIIIARREGDDLLIGDTTRLLDGESRVLYETTSGLFNTEADSEIVVQNALGYGSTGTRIVRFASVLHSVGSDITYTSDSVNGDYFTINKTGLYSMSLQIEMVSTGREFAITRNQGTLTDNPTIHPSDQVLITGNTGNASRREPITVTKWLNQGDVIRANPDGDTLSTGTGDCKFSINRIGLETNILSNSKLSTETITAKYTISVSTANPSFNDSVDEVVDFDVKEIDSHDAVTTGASWVFTAPRTSFYDVSALVSWSTNASLNTTIVNVYKNGSFNTRLSFNGNDVGSGGSTIVQLNQNETLSITANQDHASGGSRNINQVAGTCSVSIRSIENFKIYGAAQNQETVEVSSSALTLWPFGSGVWGDLTSIVLEPNSDGTDAVYDIYGSLTHFNNGTPVSNSNVYVGVSNNTGNTAAGLVRNTNESVGFMINISSNAVPLHIVSYRVTVSATTTYYLKGLRDSVTAESYHQGYRILAKKVK